MMPHDGCKDTSAKKVTLAQRVTVWVTLAVFVWQPLGVAAAGIVADPNAGANRPVVDATANGVPLVQITAPSAAGVSHNQYQQFNVDTKGAILNNSRSTSLTQQSGYVAGNPYLGCNSARIILNEVTSSNPSALRGYTEVAGSRAEVIIANPNGITCDGCGFINTSRGVLTTGTPIFGSGSLEGFRVTAGNIAINGAGLNAANIDRVDLISRTVEINGELWAKDASVIVGANEVNYTDLGVRTILGVGAVPTVGIDVAQLGGMYADKILLVGTEYGVGVHSFGTLAATAGNFSLTSNGDVVLAGNTAASGSASIASSGSFRNETTGNLGGAVVTVSAAGQLDNSGRIDGSQVTLTADAVHNQAMVVADELTINGGEVVNAGASAVLAATNTINIFAKEILENSGQATIYSLGDINIAADASKNDLGVFLNPVAKVMNSSGVIQAQRDLNIVATDVTNNRTVFSISGVITATNTNTLQPYPGHIVEDIIFGTRTSYDPLTQYIALADLISNDSNTKRISFYETIPPDYDTCWLYGCSSQRVVRTLYYETLGNSGASLQISYFPGFNPTLHINPNERRSVGTDKGTIYEQQRTRVNTTTEERIASLSAESQLLAGGNINVNLSGSLVNSMGTVSAGGSVVINGQEGADGVDRSSVVNQGQALIRTDATTGSSYFFGSFTDCMDPLCFNTVTHNRSATLPLTPQYQYATIDSIASAITAGQSIDINVGTLVNDVASSALVPGAGTSGSTSPGYTPTLPGGGLFTTITEPDQPYLVETDPRFTDYKEFLSSDYMLRQLAADPQVIQKRLGDGFYEQKLVQEQIVSRTGQAVLADYASKEDQFKALMDQGLAAAQEFEFIPGVALSAEQITALNHDIVWMVAQDVTLPNGNIERVLAPVVYFSGARRMNLTSAGALIAANEVDLITGGTLQNSGTVDGGSSLQIVADAVQNVGGVIRGDGDVAIDTTGDILNRSGNIEGRNVALTAGGDVTIDTSSAQVSVAGRDGGGAWTASNTLLGQRGSVGAAEGLEIRAGRDLRVSGADVVAGGDALLLAQGNITIDTVAKTASSHTQTQYGHYDSGQTEHQISTIQTGGDLTLASGGDTRLTSASLGSGNDLNIATEGNLTIDAVKNSAYVDEDARDGKDFMTKRIYDEAVVGAELSAGNNATLYALAGADSESGGNIAINGSHIQAGTLPGGEGRLTVAADGDVSITEARERHESLAESHLTDHGMMSTTVTGNKDRNDYDLAVGSTLSGESVQISSGKDLSIRGSAVVGTADVTLAAANDITIASAQEYQAEEHDSFRRESGLLSGGGIGITLGTRSLKTTDDATAVNQVSSSIGSTEGRVTIAADGDASVSASDIIGDQGIDIRGRNVSIEAAHDAHASDQTFEYQQSGLSLSLTVPGVNTAMAAQETLERSEQVKDSRLAALQQYRAARQGYDAYKEVKAAQDINSDTGLKVSISIGSSQSRSESHATENQARGSTLHSDGDITVIATGSEGEGGVTGGDLSVIGSTVSGRNVTLDAANDLTLAAAENTHSSHSTNSSSGGSIGISFGLSKNTKFVSFDASAYQAGGNVDGEGTRYTEADIAAAEGLTLRSGRDTALRGAQAKGETVKAEVGRDLTIASLQDTDTYRSKQSSAGGGFSVGTGGFSANLALSKGKTESDYRSVNEQSGIYAGEGGFDIQVGKHTALDGAAIDSRASADKNRLSTETLSYADLANATAYNSESSSIGISTSGPSGFGVGSEKGSDSSISRSAIAAGTLDIRDAENQQQDLDGLSRDPGQSHRALAQIFDKEAVAERQELAQLFGEEAYRAVGDLAERQRKQAAAELVAAQKAYSAAQAEGDSAGAQAAQQRMQDANASLDRWAEGGIARVALHTVVGGLQAEMGNGNALSGAAGAAASASMTGKVNDYINDALAGSNMPDTLKTLVANLATNAIDGAAGSAIDQMSGGGSSGAQAALGVDRYNRQVHWDKFLAEKAACDKAPSAKGCETIEKMGGERSQFIGDMGMSQSNVIANYDADGTVVSYTVVDKDNNQPLFIMEPLEFAAYLNASDATRGWYLLAPQWSMDSASSMLNAAAGDFDRAQEDLELAASSPEYWWTVALSAVGSEVAASKSLARNVPDGVPERGVAFFGRDNMRYYAGEIDGSAPPLGGKDRAFFFMPIDDAARVTNPASAAIESGFARSARDAWMSGEDIYGISFPTDGLAPRLPTSADAMGWRHFRPGGNTAVNVEGTDWFLVNKTREFVIDGGASMPKDSVVFRLGDQGEWVPLLRY